MNHRRNWRVVTSREEKRWGWYLVRPDGYFACESIRTYRDQRAARRAAHQHLKGLAAALGYEVGKIESEVAKCGLFEKA